MYSPEFVAHDAVDEDVHRGVDDEEQVVELDADHVPHRGAEVFFARSHPGEHKHLVQVQEHPENKQRTSVKVTVFCPKNDLLILKIIEC